MNNNDDNLINQKITIDDEINFLITEREELKFKLNYLLSKRIFSMYMEDYDNEYAIMVPEYLIEVANENGYKTILHTINTVVAANAYCYDKYYFSDAKFNEYYISRIEFSQDFSSNKIINIDNWEDWEEDDQLDHILYKGKKIYYKLMFSFNQEYWNAAENYYKDALKIDKNNIRKHEIDCSVTGYCNDKAVLMTRDENEK